METRAIWTLTVSVTCVIHAGYRRNGLDGDGICGDVDNCPIVYNPDQIDSYGNGIGDVCRVVTLHPADGTYYHNYFCYDVKFQPYCDQDDSGIQADISVLRNRQHVPVLSVYLFWPN